MTRHPLVGEVRDDSEKGFLRPASVNHEWTPTREPASRGRADQGWHLARNPIAGAPPTHLGYGKGCEERLRVWMERVFKDLLHRANLSELAEVHDGHSVGDVTDGGHVVGD